MIEFKYILLLLCAILFTFLHGCSGVSTAQNIVNETVLTPDSSIIVQTDWATIKISSSGKKTRNYTWDGKTVSVDLIQRQERWNGSLGLYHPQVRPPHNGVVHMVVEEGQQHFDTIDAAINWLKLFGERPIYRDDGLVVIAHLSGIDSDKKFVNISVWQILVNGQKTTKLPGSQNSRIIEISNT